MIRKLLALVRIRLKNWAVYRFDVLSSIMGMMIPIVGLSLYWSYTLKHESINVDSAYFSTKTIIVYYIIVFVMELLYSYEIAFSVEEDISSGRMNGYLVLPCNYMLIKLSEYVATNILYFTVLAVILITMIAFSVIKISLQILMVYLLLLILAMIFHFLFLVTLGIITVWLKNINNMIYFFETFFGLLAGAVVPLSLFPKSLKWLSWNPFSLSIYVPTEMLLTGGIPLLEPFALGIWCVVVYLIYKFCWSKALRSYQAYGG